MSVRRIVASLGLVLAASACSENFSSPAVMDSAPHFLKWATPTRPEFAFEGASAVGSRFANLSSPTPAVVDQSSSATRLASSLSWPHTVGTGPNRLLVVGLSVENGETVSAASYRGTALTFLGARSNGGFHVELWYQKAPPSGTGTVAVSLSGAANMVGGAVSFFGVDQLTPVAGFTSASGTSSAPSVATTSGPADVVFSALAIDGNATSRTPAAGQTQRWNLTSSSADIGGGASTAAGGSTSTMSWAASSSKPWALGAVAIKPAPHLALTQYQATFWAKRGEPRTLQINYAAGGGTSPFMNLVVSDPIYVPGRGNLAVGDSVLVTATVDPNAIAITLQPHGMLFGTPSQLQIWYGGAGGDLNDDGVVNSTDAFIETFLLSMWYQATPTDPWFPMWATKSLSTKSFTASLAHFSGYAVSW